MIVEGLLTTVNAAGIPNIAPMGPIVQGNFRSLTLRPFRGSVTFTNLLETRAGVFHVVDRVDVIVDAVIHRLDEMPQTTPAKVVNGVVLADCCRWVEFRITDVDLTEERSVMSTDVLHIESRRDFLGFNRARHAILEGAILATRLHILPRSEVLQSLSFLTPAVGKTGDKEECEAFRRLTEYINERLSVESVR